MSAFEARNRFGQLLDAVQHEPVTVTRNGRPVAVLMSVNDYERMRGTACLRLPQTVEQMHREAQAKGLSEEMLDQLLQRDS
ncbi:MAG: type II toxin-antitoxin system Phd/YefM family antitoxin [Kiloniellales bacterium]